MPAPPPIEMFPASGSFSVVGNNVAISYGSGPSPVTLVAAPGVFGVVGYALSIDQRRLFARSGSFSVVGIPVTLTPPPLPHWFSSGACGCTCTYSAGFYYDNASCSLYFVAAGVKKNCVVVDWSTTGAIVTISRNGTPITSSLIPVSTSVYPGGGVAYQKWMPTAGDVYTATVVIPGCGVNKTLTITIPTPANTACNCCTLKVLDYVVVSGFTAEFANMNGTYAATASGGGPSNCCYYFPPVTAPAMPRNPCGIATFSGSPPLLCANGPPPCLFMVPSGGCDVSGNRYYYYQGGGSVSVCINASTGTGTLSLVYYYAYARRRPVDSGITNPEGCIANGGGGDIGYSATFTLTCANGILALVTNGFPSQTPSVQAFYR